MLNEQFEKLDLIFKNKNQKEMCNFFSTELVDTDAPEYKEIKKYCSNHNYIHILSPISLCTKVYFFIQIHNIYW